MSVDRSALSGVEPKPLAPLAPSLGVAVDATHVAKGPGVVLDGAHLSAAHGPKPDPLATYGDEGHGEGQHDLLSDVAHKAHSPHGAMHAVEAGEHMLAPVGRALGRLARSGASAAEAQVAAQAVVAESAVAGHALHQHHGLLVRAEQAVGRGFTRLGAWMAKGIRAIPGGGKALDWTARAWGGPARALGPGLDKALVGTQVGKAVTFTGSGGRMVGAMGGRLPIIGALLGGLIAVVDYRDAVHTIQDPKQSTKEKVLAGTQGAFSVVSGFLGMGALAAAGAVALGFTAPFSIPALMLGAAVTGVVAFGVSLFRGGAAKAKGEAAH